MFPNIFSETVCGELRYIKKKAKNYKLLEACIDVGLRHSATEPWLCGTHKDCRGKDAEKYIQGVFTPCIYFVLLHI